MARVLVVDDELNNLKAVKRVFARTEYAMEFAQCGEEALKLVPQFKPDLVVLDIMMPGIDGYEVCRRLKSDTGTAVIMVLVVSARSILEDRLMGYEAGADDYIAKPYDPEELRAKARILLRLKKAQDDLLTLNGNLEEEVEIKTRELVKKERQAIVGQMVQGIVHNLRGPITVVHGRADIAARIGREWLAGRQNAGSPESAEKLVRNLDSLLEAVVRTEQLIDSLLLRGRKEAGEKKENLNLNDVIVQEWKFLDADMYLKHDVRKQLDLDPSIPSVCGVYSDFSQVIYNLTKNASDAMKESELKLLTIVTRQDDRNIYAVFSDTGSGISSDDLPRIFDPFFTTKTAKDPDGEGEPGGTGLGLYSSVQLLKSYGGGITVQSRPGVGTTFTVVIPKQSPLDSVQLIAESRDDPGNPTGSWRLSDE